MEKEPVWYEGADAAGAALQDRNPLRGKAGEDAVAAAVLEQVPEAFDGGPPDAPCPVPCRTPSVARSDDVRTGDEKKSGESS